jgi:hypothetical protein
MGIQVQGIFTARCDICDKPLNQLINSDELYRAPSEKELAGTLVLRNWYVSTQLMVAVCPSCRNGSLLPLACQCIASSRFYATTQSLECDYRESGGVRCEVLGVHDRHAWGSHTIEHSRWGNGYHCSSVDERI